ncbi:hypothetical protein [Azospirillum halopraeferens]|uniref:hypothetical protein n=1 Tax=Azospirillum halopraeferens TaxID=34010 RepID=UPI0012EB62B0
MPRHSKSRHILLTAAARTLSPATVLRLSDMEAQTVFAAIPWPETNGRPVCPACDCDAVLWFLGVACPTCNKLLLLVFGADLLLAHFEPYRLHPAVVGAATTAAAVVWEWGQRRHAVVCPADIPDHTIRERISLP